jgi:EAL domain-containing protein (putative c-di-GMP-specific phosphodiesterase class I)
MPTCTRGTDRLGLENDLRHAVTNNDLEVHYQPIVARSGCASASNPHPVDGTVNRSRWSRSSRSPRTGIIEPLGTWVLQQACTTFASGSGDFCRRPDYITVNASSRQLMQQGFL